MRPELARVVELQVVLGIIVRLVGIVADIPVVVVVFPRPIVATVFVILFQVYPVPGDTTPLIAQQIRQSQRVSAAEPSHHGKERGRLHKAVPDVPVGDAHIHGQVKIQPAGQFSGRYGGRRHEGTKGPAAQFYGSTGFWTDESRVHVDAGAKGSGTAGRRTQSALHLYPGEETCQGRNVHPEHFLGLGVVQGNAIERHVDLRPLAATDGHGRIPEARSVLVVGNYGRQQIQGHGQGGRRITLAEFFLPYHIVCNRSFLAGAGGRNHHRVQAFLRSGAERQHEQYCKKQCFFHLPYDGINRIKFYGYNLNRPLDRYPCYVNLFFNQLHLVQAGPFFPC